MADKTYVYQVIREAVQELGGRATNTQIKNYIKNK